MGVVGAVGRDGGEEEDGARGALGDHLAGWISFLFCFFSSFFIL